MRSRGREKKEKGRWIEGEKTKLSGIEGEKQRKREGKKEKEKFIEEDKERRRRK